MIPGVGIIGVGKLVEFLVPCLRAKGFHVEAIWSSNLQDANSFASKLQIPFATDSVDSLLLKKQVELIVVACPPHLHSTIVSKAFNIGKHVVCNWPASLNCCEMKEMVERSSYYPSLISILCHPLRFLSVFQTLEQLIKQSKQDNSFLGILQLIEINVTGDTLHRLGDLYNVTCDHNMGGGLLNNVASHLIDIVYYLTHCRAKRVNGILRTFQSNNLSHQSNPGFNNSNTRRITTDDYCNFQLEMDFDPSTSSKSTYNESKSSYNESKSTYNESKSSSSNSLIANVTINSNVIGQYDHCIKVIGSRGYLVLRESSLFGFKFPKVPNSNNVQQEELLFCEQDETLDALNLNSRLPKPYDLAMVKLIATLSNAFEGHGQGHSNNVLDIPDSSYSSATSSIMSSESESGSILKSSSSTTVNSLNMNQKNNSLNSESVTMNTESLITGNNESVTGNTASWAKDAVSVAATFEDGQYIQAVIDAIKKSNENREWIRVAYNTPFGPQSPLRKSHNHHPGKG